MGGVAGIPTLDRDNETLCLLSLCDLKVLVSLGAVSLFTIIAKLETDK